MASPPLSALHVWVYKNTPNFGSSTPSSQRYSEYECVNCGVPFRHYYNGQNLHLFAAIDHTEGLGRCPQSKKEGTEGKCENCGATRWDHAGPHLFYVRERVDIKGIDKPALLQALWANAKPKSPVLQTLAAMMPPLSRAEAQSQLNSDNGYIDYCFARCIKADLSKDTADPDLYDREYGTGAFAEVVKNIRSSEPLTGQALQDFNKDLDDLASLIKCAQCQKPKAPKRCTGCDGGASYCDRECQIKHWKIHKNYCTHDLPFPQDLKRYCECCGKLTRMGCKVCIMPHCSAKCYTENNESHAQMCKPIDAHAVQSIQAMMVQNGEMAYKLITLKNGTPLMFLPNVPGGWASKNVFDLSKDERPIIKDLGITAEEIAKLGTPHACLAPDYLNVMRFMKMGEFGTLMQAMKPKSG